MPMLRRSLQQDRATRRRSQSPTSGQRSDLMGSEVRWKSQSPSRAFDKDVNMNKGPTVHLIEANSSDPQVFTFDKCEEGGGGVAAVASDDIVVVRRASGQAAKPCVGAWVALKAACLVGTLLAATYLLNWYSMNYSKSSEVLSLSLLLMLHIYIFQPKTFLLCVIYNWLNKSPGPACRRPSYNTQ